MNQQVKEERNRRIWRSIQLGYECDCRRLEREFQEFQRKEKKKRTRSISRRGNRKGNNIRESEQKERKQSTFGCNHHCRLEFSQVLCHLTEQLTAIQDTLASSMAHQAGNSAALSSSTGDNGSTPRAASVESGSQGLRYIMPMPPPGTPGAPWFTGSNVTEFLDRFSDLCEDHGLGLLDKFRKVPRYCERGMGESIKAMTEFVAHDWEEFCKAMQKEYRQWDSEQQMYTRDYLECLVSKASGYSKSSADVKSYCRQFKGVSHRLVRQGQLDEYTRCMWFIKGLQESLQQRIIRKCSLDPDDAQTMKFEAVYSEVVRNVEAREAVDRFVTTKEKHDQLSALTDLRQPMHRKDLEYTLDPPVIPAAPVPAPTAVTEDAVSKLVDEMAKMTINQTRMLQQSQQDSRSLHAQMQQLVTTGRKWEGGLASMPDSRVQGTASSGIAGEKAGNLSMNAGNRTSAFNTHPGCCNWCNDPNHYVPVCPIREASIARGDIHLVPSPDGRGMRVHEGRKEHGGPPLILRPNLGITKAQAIEEALHALKSGSRDPSKVQSFRLGSLHEEPEDNEDTEEECESGFYTFAAKRDVPNKVRREQPVQAVKDPYARIWKENAKKEERLPTVKNRRPGTYVTNPNLFGQSDSTDPMTLDNDVTKPVDSKPAISASKERTRAPKLVNIVQDEEDPQALLHAMLDAKPDVTVQDILSVAPGLRKLWFRSLSEEAAAGLRNRKEIPGKVTAVRFTDEIEGTSGADENFFAVACPVVSASVNGIGVRGALLDSGAEVNLMSETLARRAGLVLHKYPQSSLVPVRGPRASFIGVCDDAEVTIGGVRVPTPIFVADGIEQHLILGRPFDRKARLYSRNEDDGSCVQGIKSVDGQVVEWTSVGAQHHRNQRAEQVFPAGPSLKE